MAIHASADTTVSPTYPYLGVLKHDHSFVVLFNAPNCGIVVFTSTNSTYAVGYTCREWTEYSFERFNGTITLANG